jgi:hypothetical protein
MDQLTPMTVCALPIRHLTCTDEIFGTHNVRHYDLYRPTGPACPVPDTEMSRWG